MRAAIARAHSTSMMPAGCQTWAQIATVAMSVLRAKLNRIDTAVTDCTAISGQLLTIALPGTKMTKIRAATDRAKLCSFVARATAARAVRAIHATSRRSEVAKPALSLGAIESNILRPSQRHRQTHEKRQAYSALSIEGINDSRFLAGRKSLPVGAPNDPPEDFQSSAHYRRTMKGDPMASLDQSNLLNRLPFCASNRFNSECPNSILGNFNSRCIAFWLPNGCGGHHHLPILGEPCRKGMAPTGCQFGVQTEGTGTIRMEARWRPPLPALSAHWRSFRGQLALGMRGHRHAGPAVGDARRVVKGLKQGERRAIAPCTVQSPRSPENAPELLEGISRTDRRLLGFGIGPRFLDR